MSPSKLDAAGGKPSLKKSLPKLIRRKEGYDDLCDIWRIKNTKTKQFAFTQQHSYGFILRKLDYIFILNGFEELVSTEDFMIPISKGHSPVLFSLSKGEGNIRGKGYWKFNSPLS